MQPSVGSVEASLDGRREWPVEQQGGDPEHAGKPEHQLRHGGARASGPVRGQIRRGCRQDAECPGNGADQAVTRKQRGSPVRLDGLGQHGLLERKKDAGIARGRVHRADKGEITRIRINRSDASCHQISTWHEAAWRVDLTRYPALLSRQRRR
jgi:hypothetical protein